MDSDPNTKEAGTSPAVRIVGWEAQTPDSGATIINELTVGSFTTASAIQQRRLCSRASSAKSKPLRSLVRNLFSVVSRLRLRNGTRSTPGILLPPGFSNAVL